ncbi:glycosyl hydrolase [Maribacter algarum]|uniref:Glycosyl hydrolase n=1 Tax=Maribacter algarum (ex Zhang et al. 2020) TaxID=2578118 RepID=A0A5S3PHT2_9FLAO|nr:family 10 glycosylhydrolase [Maribacter algarum]TMM53835.1 glycosyl hydrolase [Maribacter algarum]
MLRTLSLLILFISVSSCSVFKSIPQPRTEFRGFWVATVVNIDWPKNGNDSAEKQKRDFLAILNFYQDLNFNAAIVQIRTAGDAFYDSNHAPWSRFLTGTEGEVPTSKSSLLKWMIDETHKRGIEFHAWLNPYSATFDLKTEILSEAHDYNQHPEWMLKYGKKYYYDPGLPEVQQKMASVIDEVVTNYDVDGIHFDDYFYPYRIQGEVFQDSISYYNCALPNQNLEDWRRSNIDSLIKNSHDIIKSRKPWVQFGVSPFGVWKNKSTDPKGSDTKAGQTTYEDLYADPLLWMEKGWLDYLIPQVYWSMELPVASHRKIVDWWSDNSQNTNLYIGNGPYKIRNNSDKAWDDKKELPNQISYSREKNVVQGNAFFSAKSLMNDNADVVKYLKRKHYKEPALSPVSKLASQNPKNFIAPKSIRKSNDTIELKFDDQESIRYVMIYPSGKNEKETYPLKKLITKLSVENGKEVTLPSEIIGERKYVALTFIDFYGRESQPIIVNLKQSTE